MTAPLAAPAAWVGDDEVSVLRAPLTTDRYGAETRDWPAAAVTLLRGVQMQPLGSRTVRAAVEDEKEREWTAERHILVAPSTADLLPTDRVRWHGADFEMDGPALVLRDPFGAVHHVEAIVKRLLG